MFMAWSSRTPFRIVPGPPCLCWLAMGRQLFCAILQQLPIRPVSIVPEGGRRSRFKRGNASAFVDANRPSWSSADQSPLYLRYVVHLLRHSLATDMLRKGASLDEIGELL